MSTKEMYEIAFTNKELSSDDLDVLVKVYSKSFKQEKEEIYGQNGRMVIDFKMNKLNTSRETNVTVCIDYWLTIDAYFNGALIDSETTYLGRYCEETNIQAIWWIDNGDGTYSGGPVNEQDEIIWGEVTDESNFEPLDTTALTLANFNNKDKAFAWNVYSATGGVKFTASMRVYCKTNFAGLHWIIDALANEGLESTGNSTDSKGWTVLAEKVSWTDTSIWSLARGELKFKDVRQKMHGTKSIERKKEIEIEGAWLESSIFR